MNIEIPSLNLVVLAPQFVIIVTALVVLLSGLLPPQSWGGERRGRGEEQKTLPAWLSLAGVIISAAVMLVTWGREASSFQNLVLSPAEGMAVADGYSLFLNLVFLTTAGLSILISIEYVVREGLASGEYYALLLLATAGMMLMGAATNLVIIFLALEILSIPLYVLTGLNRARLESGEAALKYFLLGAFASGFFLYGIALTYGATGTTNLAGIVSFLGSASPVTSATLSAGLSVVEGAGPYLYIALGLLLIGFAFKVALVPFHMWVPDVYQGAPTSVTAFMSVGAKAAGFAALARVLLYAFPTLASSWAIPLSALAVLTMTLGNLAAIAQSDIKRMLAYSSIAHAGYILVGVVAANEAGAAGVLFYLLAYAFMNVGAFATAIVVGKRGEPGVEIADYAGLASRRPFLAAAMATFMLSLAGVPPLAGFMGKFYLFSAAVQADLTWLAIIGVLNSVLSVFFYLRVIVVMYMREAEEPKPISLPWPLGVAVALAALGVLALGLWPSPLLTIAQQAIGALLGS
jgi:NADH-quinone oxidoreductase subunit N